MERVRDKAGSFTETCRVCGHQERYQRSDVHRKVVTNAADGKRRDHLHHFWKDAIQPWNKDGTENRLYTEIYGHNPYSPHKEVPKDAPPQDTKEVEEFNIQFGGKEPAPADIGARSDADAAGLGDSGN